MRFGLPQVSYAKAIDFWFGGSKEEQNSNIKQKA
jgi:hypothetical protein